MRDQRLTDPVRVAVRRDVERSVERLGQRQQRRDRERRVRADEHARRGGDDDGVISDLRRLHVRERERGRDGAANDRGLDEGRVVEPPLIGERSLARHGHAEGRGRALIHGLRPGLARDARRRGHIDDLIHPRAILAVRDRPDVLVVAPTEGVRAGRHAEDARLPVHFAGDGKLRAAVHVETQAVVVQFARYFPPEAQGAGAGHGGFKIGFTARRHRAAHGRVFEIMRHSRLAAPRDGAGHEGQIRYVQRLGQRAQAEHAHGAAAESRGQRGGRGTRVRQGARDGHVADADRGVGLAVDQLACEQNFHDRARASREREAVGHRDGEADPALRRLLIRHRQHRRERSRRLQGRRGEGEQVRVVAQAESQRVLAAVRVEDDVNRVGLTARHRRVREPHLAHAAGLRDVIVLFRDGDDAAAGRAIVTRDHEDDRAGAVAGSAVENGNPRRVRDRRPVAAEVGGDENGAVAAALAEALAARLVHVRDREITRLRVLRDEELIPRHRDDAGARHADGIGLNDIIHTPRADRARCGQDGNPSVRGACRPRANRSRRDTDRTRGRREEMRSRRWLDRQRARLLTDGEGFAIHTHHAGARLRAQVRREHVAEIARNVSAQG